MTRRCELSGVGPMVGNNVSHAQNKTRRRFLPNLNQVALLSDELNMRLRLRVSAAALRSVEHCGGIDRFLLKANDQQLSKKALGFKKTLLKKQAASLPLNLPSLKFLFLPLGFMVFVLVAANYTVQFPIYAFGLEKWATWGTLVYPLTFLVNDLTNRFYGTQRTTQLVLASAAVGLPLSYIFADARIAVASALAFLIGQQLDNKIFNHLRQKAWWRAPLASSVLATLADTWIFYALAFGGAVASANYFGQPAPLWVGWSAGDSLFKLAVGLCLLLPYRFFVQQILSRQNAAAL